MDKLEEDFRKDFSIYPIAMLVQDKILEWVRKRIPEANSGWYYESDGDEHSRTHYLVKHNDPEFGRIDFPSKREALRILEILKG